MVEAVRALPCSRCQTALQFLGTQRFREEFGAQLRGSRGPTLAQNLGRAVGSLLGRPSATESPSINALPTWRCWEPRPRAADRPDTAQR